MSDEIKQDETHEEHDVEAHKKHQHFNLNDEPTEPGAEDSDDDVEAHLKHHRNN